MLQVLRSYNGRKSIVKNSPAAGPVALCEALKLYSVENRSGRDCGSHRESKGNEKPRNKLRDDQSGNKDRAQNGLERLIRGEDKLDAVSAEESLFIENKRG